MVDHLVMNEASFLYCTWQNHLVMNLASYFDSLGLRTSYTQLIFKFKSSYVFDSNAAVARFNS